jgi:CBS domain-containing protein
MQVSEVMTRGVRSMSPNESVMQAAQAMQALDVGVIPVCEGERLIGIVTDRDIVVRAVAQGCVAEATPLSSVMTKDACWCYDDQSVEEATEQMCKAQIRRLPVVDHEQHLVGIVSLGDVATKAGEQKAGEALEEISQPSRPDRSGQSTASGSAGGGQSKSRH